MLETENGREALKEVTLDVEEGADIIITYHAKDAARRLRHE